MSVFASLAEGWRRAIRAPSVTAGVLVAAWALSVLTAPVMTSRLVSFSESAPSSELEAYARDAGQTAADAASLFGSPLSGYSVMVFADNPWSSVVVMSALPLVLWGFLAGGILDRLARARPVGTAAFFAACGVYFFRFLRLALILGPLYWLALRYLTGWGLLVVWLGLGFVLDFTIVRAVVEDRRSMIGAIAAALRFTRRRVVRSTALYVLNLLIMMALVTAWQSVAPLVNSNVTFLLVWVWVLANLWARMAWLGSEVAFFQSELAHARYTAAPLPMWPDSPAVEGIENLSRLKR